MCLVNFFVFLPVIAFEKFSGHSKMVFIEVKTEDKDNGENLSAFSKKNVSSFAYFKQRGGMYEKKKDEVDIVNFMFALRVYKSEESRSSRTESQRKIKEGHKP
ncbi:hypothetical protein CEXT_231601 [Caerostris extrusa]|uniref:Uncharacterized protein n=1 Tax=Caerostris extrusa TaxID=172846 RepID=A0AAV4XJV7_CAEEX|nr:hypothetical protein CEXT_231601 [Caerostris extrusa]